MVGFAVIDWLLIPIAAFLILAVCVAVAAAISVPLGTFPRIPKPPAP